MTLIQQTPKLLAFLFVWSVRYEQLSAFFHDLFLLQQEHHPPKWIKLLILLNDYIGIRYQSKYVN